MGSVEAFALKDSPIENLRPIKVRVIGAGYSGIYLGVRIPQRIQNVDFQIYEKNEGVGGTWWENRYPGCACDVPAHCYQYTFNPNPKWTGFYASATEIREYLGSIAEKYGVMRHTNLSHKVTACVWDEDVKKWQITGQNLVTGETFNDDADVVISCKGTLNEPVWPKVSGLQDFKGKMMHSAKWDDKYDLKNKSIGLIGGGSSGVQILPEIQKIEGAKVDLFVRTPTYIANLFFDETTDQLGMDPKKLQFSEEQKEAFFNDPEHYLKFRKMIEGLGAAYHAMTLKGSPLQGEMKEGLQATMRGHLSTRQDICETLTPKFAPGCRRLIPGPGYLRSLLQDNVEFHWNTLDSVTTKGVQLRDGKHLDLDVIICATGFDSSGIPLYEVRGRNNETLEKRFSPYPETYMSLAVDGFPNYFMVMGPNAAQGAGSLSVVLEKEGDYITKCIRKLQKEDYVTMVPKKSRVKDFQAYVETYFAKTIYTDKCSSWYKNDGGRGDRVIGLWPGSTTHMLEMLRSPRWEDYEYESKNDNNLKWLGNGWSMCHMSDTGCDPTWFLDPEFVDKANPGRPEDDPQFKLRPFSNN